MTLTRPLILLLLVVTPVMAAEPAPLLGSIDGNDYLSPNGALRIALPFDKNNEAGSTVKDVIFAEALNIIFEDKQDDIRYRIDLSYPENSSFDVSAENRLRQYEGLINRGYSGTALLIHFDKVGHNLKRYLYKQVTKEKVRFHYIQISPYRKRLVLLWTDFKQTDDTPENEDNIIDGKHPGIIRARDIMNSIKKQA